MSTRARNSSRAFGLLAAFFAATAAAQQDTPVPRDVLGPIDDLLRRGFFAIPTTTLVTPVLATDIAHGGTWQCWILNVGDQQLDVTLRAFSATTGQEIALEAACGQPIGPGQSCSGFWQTGIEAHYCKFSFSGSKESVRASMQVTADDGYSLFAEAH
jgi:hypothetical protein